MEQVHKNSLSNTSESYSLRIDRDQATTQIEALGHKLNAVCVRAFLPKEDPRYGPNTGRKADKLDWKQIEQWQAQGYGIYIVVNGGGHKDENITDCRAIFCEFDDRPIEDQINFWQDLGLPEPSLQIATRKSVHTYWIFDQSIPPVQWRFLQTALLNYTKSDPALKNPSRVMRLAGAYHTKPGHEPQRCDIIHQSESRYSYQELISAIGLPEPQPSERSQIPLLQPELKPESHSVTPKYQRYEDICVPVTAAVPLEVCLSKESRSVLASGCLEGERNVGGAKLVRDLIGTANYLAALAQPFDGDPHRLLSEYANRCTPPLDAPEIESIWKSAQKDCPTPSCKPVGVEACIRGWYWKNHVKPNQTARKNNNHVSTRGFGNGDLNHNLLSPITSTATLGDRIRSLAIQAEAQEDISSAISLVQSELKQIGCVTGDTSTSGDTSSPFTATLTTTVTSVTSILEQGLPEWSEQSKLDALQSVCGISKTSFAQLVASRRCQSDEVMPSDRSQLERLIDWKNVALDFNQVIPHMADDLLHDGRILNIDPIMLWQYLFPAVLSMLGSKANLIVGSHQIPAIAWTCIVGESGIGKS